MSIKQFIDLTKTEEFFSSPYGRPTRLDERLWIPPVGESRVRLLPQPIENSVPYLVVQRHSYNYQDQVLWAVCPKTIGQKCPICDVAWKYYYATPEVYGSKASLLQKIGADLRPITRYYFNVFIVEDPENFENNGEVKVLSMGRKLWNIVQQGWKEIGLAIFDPEEGFDLVIRKQHIGQYPDYTTSSFARKQSNVGKLGELLERAYVLSDLITVFSNEELIEMFSVIPEVREFFSEHPSVEKKVLAESGIKKEVEEDVAEKGESAINGLATFLPGIEEGAEAEEAEKSEKALDIDQIDQLLKDIMNG